jgi:hypothetical protein
MFVHKDERNYIYLVGNHSWLLWYETIADQDQSGTIGSNSWDIYAKHQFDTKLIFNNLVLLVMYIASRILNEIDKTNHSSKLQHRRMDYHIVRSLIQRAGGEHFSVTQQHPLQWLSPEPSVIQELCRDTTYFDRLSQMTWHLRLLGPLRSNR